MATSSMSSQYMIPAGELSYKKKIKYIANTLASQTQLLYYNVKKEWAQIAANNYRITLEMSITITTRYSDLLLL